MATVAQLNQVASQTYCKRPRTSELEDKTPRKRQSVEHEESQDQTEIRSTGRRSATRLQSRTSLFIISPAPRPRGRPSGKNGRGIDDTPQASETSKLDGKLQDEKNPKKKRVLNRKKDKEPIKAKSFDKTRLSTININPLTAAGLTLTTIDSPAKNTRARKEGTFKRLSLQSLKPTEIDVESRKASPELGEEEDLPTSGQPDSEKSDDDRGTASPTRAAKKPDHDVTTDQVSADNADEDVGNVDESTWREPEVNWIQNTTEQDRDYTRRQCEDEEREQQRKKGESKKPAEPATKSQVNGKQSSKPRDSRREETEEHTDPEDGEEEVNPTTQPEPVKKRGRPKMSEEERHAKEEARNAKKEAAAQKRQENAIETGEASIRDFDARAKDFIEDIKDLARGTGGLKAWSTLGAGAGSITPEVSKKKMGGPKVQNLWEKLTQLKDMFSGEEETDEERVDHLIRRLKAKCTWGFLSGNDKNKPGDVTVVDLYEQLIPLSVNVLKIALKERFVAVHKVSWQELQNLIEISISLCDVASSWKPRPSSLNGGILKAVRVHIRPNLAIIHNVVDDHLNRMEWEERRKRENTAFTKRQELRREEKRLAWEKLSRGCPSNRVLDPSNERNEQGADADEAEETHDEGHPAAVTPNHARPRSSLQRRPTEEIPAPDPNITWSEQENVALLNGLQRYLDEDRYARILGDNSYTDVLSDKSVSQCMAQAKFYQAGCHQILKEKAETGDNSFDWLRTV